MAAVSNSISRYADAHTSAPPALLNGIERQTYATEVLPHMITSRSTGRLLALLSVILKPMRVLEVGTFTGYGTLCLAEGLAHGGHVDTIENNPEVAFKARRHFNEAGMASVITVHEGDAKQVIPSLNVSFDLVFLDADKKQYSQYYKLLMPKLNKHGLLIADNVLWYGKVLEPLDDADAKAIDEFNNLVQNDVQTQNILLTVDDGLMLVYKNV